MTSSTERRRHARVKLPGELPVAWQCGGQRMVSTFRTFGLGGIFIWTPDPLPVGKMVNLIFDLPGGEVRARAVVRHSQPGKGMGVQFMAMSTEARGRLDQVLKRSLHQSRPSPTLSVP